MFNHWSLTTLGQYWSAAFLFAVIRMSNSFLVNTKESEVEDGDLAPGRSYTAFFLEASRIHAISFPLLYSKLCFFPCSVQAKHQSITKHGVSFSKCPSPLLRAAGAAEVVQCLIFLRCLSFSQYTYKHTQASCFMGASCEHRTWKWKMTACEIIQLKRSQGKPK